MSLYSGFAQAEIAYRQEYLQHLGDPTSPATGRRRRTRRRWQGRPDTVDTVTTRESGRVRH
jgi:hypothetical protein